MEEEIENKKIELLNLEKLIERNKKICKSLTIASTVVGVLFGALGTYASLYFSTKENPETKHGKLPFVREEITVGGFYKTTHEPNKEPITEYYDFESNTLTTEDGYIVEPWSATLDGGYERTVVPFKVKNEELFEQKIDLAVLNNDVTMLLNAIEQLDSEYELIYGIDMTSENSNGSFMYYETGFNAEKVRTILETSAVNNSITTIYALFSTLVGYAAYKLSRYAQKGAREEISYLINESERLNKKIEELVKESEKPVQRKRDIDIEV